MRTWRHRRAGVLTGLILMGLNECLCPCARAQKAIETPPSQISEVTVLPSLTDSRISTADIPHLILYDANAPQGKLLLFLPGTNGIATRGPRKLFEAAIAQGYRVINLSYINKQAVARICRGETLAKDPDCTEKFRTERVFGDALMPLIPDDPQARYP